MTDAELSARLRANLTAFRHLQSSHSSLKNWRLPGVSVFALPAFPRALHQQQALFADAEALEAALAPLEDFFRGHGIPAWRVQVPPGEPRAEQALSRAGYRPENTLIAMGMCLADGDWSPPGVPLEKPATLEEFIHLNAEAFGPDIDVVLKPWHQQPPAHVHALAAREAGPMLACGLTHDVEDTAGIYLVATSPAARRRGLASEVLRGLLLEARARGRAATVLQATPLGHGVYQRLGFRDLGLWTNWVRRL